MRVKKKYLFLLNLIIAVVFAILFFKNQIGLNLLIFEIITIPLMLWLNRPLKINYLTGTLFAATIFTLIFSIIINTFWCILINNCLFILFSVALAFKSIKSLLNLSAITIEKIFISQLRILKRWHKPKSNKIIINFRKIFLFVILPFFFVCLFIGLYAWASPFFKEKFSFAIDAFVEFLEKIDFLFFIYLLIGLCIANILFIPTSPSCLYRQDLNSSEILTRKRKRKIFGYYFRFNGLQLQNMSGIIILSLLNFLILFFNILDITNVWFNFEWSGETLKAFVHEGTYVLLFSILISAGIALYYFKKNLNFYKNNKLLKSLTVIWLVQNIILTFSVVVRNYWYIQNFGLAYKRIALLFFLSLTIFSLFTIIWKILFKKTNYYLFKINSFAVMLAFVISAVFNWDIVIAKYNFARYEKIVLDINFLAKLDISAYKYTYKTDQEIETIAEVQKKLVNKYEKSPFKKILKEFYDFEFYKHNTNNLKENFLENYKNKNFLEWNYADDETYKQLTIRN